MSTRRRAVLDEGTIATAEASAARVGTDDAGPRVAEGPRSGTRARVLGASGRYLRDGRFLSVVVLAIVWQLVVTALHVNHLVLPTTLRVLRDWGHMMADGSILHAMSATLELVGVAYGISVGAGVPLGLAMGTSRVVRGAAGPYVALILATPFVAFLPVLILWFGTADTLVIAAGVVFSAPYVMVNVDAGVRGVPKNLRDMALVFEGSSLDVFRKVLLPGSMDSVILGLKQGVSQAIKGVVIAQILSSIAGLGGLIGAYSGAFRTGHLIAIVATVLLFVLIVNSLLDHLWSVVGRSWSQPGSTGDNIRSGR